MMSRTSRSLWSEKVDFPASHWESVVGETPNLDASHFFFLPVSVRYVFTWLWMDTDNSNSAASLRIKMFAGRSYLPSIIYVVTAPSEAYEKSAVVMGFSKL